MGAYARASMGADTLIMGRLIARLEIAGSGRQLTLSRVSAVRAPATYPGAGVKPPVSPTNGNPGGKQPSGNGALRSPFFSSSAASR